MPESNGLDPTLQNYVNSQELAETYDEYFASSALFEFDRYYVAKRLGFPRDPREEYSILDLGCGTGRHILQAVKNNCHAAGVDLNPHMLAKAKAKARKMGIPYSERSERQEALPLRILTGDMENPPIAPDERFDAILIMFSTLGLVLGNARRVRFLTGARKRLKNGGKLILHVHNEDHSKKYIPFLSKTYLEEAALTLAGKLESGDHLQRSYRGVLDLRLHYFTAKELAGLLREAGFTIIDFFCLSDARNGEYSGSDPEHNANGFLVTAQVRGDS